MATSAPVSTITLAASSLVSVYVADQNGLNSAGVSLSSPQSVAVCSGCQAGVETTVGSYSAGDELVFTFTDESCGQSWESTDASHVAITQLSSELWQLRYDDAGAGCSNPDGDYNDLVVDVSTQSISPLESLGHNGRLENSAECSTGQPVNCATGNFTHSFTDLQVPGRGIALSLQRTYNSLTAATKSMFGYGWVSSYEMNLAFDANGDATVQQEDGAQATFLADGSGGFIAPPRVLGTLVPNGDGTYTLTIRGKDQWRFSSAGQLLSETDRNGYSTTLGYDASSQLHTVTDPAGRTLTFTYGDNGLVSSATDSVGRSVSYEYDDAENLTSVTDVNLGITRFGYDSGHLLTTMTDARNDGSLTNTYDTQARVTQQVDPMARTTTFAYDSAATTITTPNGNVTVEHYDGGILASMTKGYGTSSAATWTYGFDQTLGASSITDPNGHTRTASYDLNGNQTSATDAVGNTTTSEYNGYDEPTSVTDPSGVTTIYSYDGAGNPTSVSRPLTATGDTQTTSYGYDDGSHPGDLTSITDPDNHTWQLTYNADGALAARISPEGNKSTYIYSCTGGAAAGCYSGVGLLYKHTSPRDKSSRYTYNARGQKTSTTDPLGHTTTYTYDANGNKTNTVNADNNATTYQYDADNELQRVQAPESATLQNGYDADGNLTSQTDGAGHPTTYTYDALDRVISATDPLSHETTYTYDGAGNQTSNTDPDSASTTYSYDHANELTAVHYSDGTTPDVSYQYDANQLRTKMTDGTGTTSYTYDSLNRLISETTGAGNNVSYGYDLADHVTALGYPNGQTATQSFTDDGQLASVSDWLGNTTTFSYSADSELTRTTFPSGTDNADSYGYSNTDQLKSVHMSKGSTTLAQLDYAHDPAGLLTSDAEHNLPAQNTTGTTAYSYDGASNVTQLAGQTGYSYNTADQLQSSPDASYDYNTLGQRTTTTPTGGSATTYTYDQAGTLTTVAPPTGDATSNTYDGSGLLASQTTGSSTKTLTWDQAASLPLLLSDGTNSYIYGPNDLPIEQIDGSDNPTYLHHDQLGSTRLITDQAGSTIGTFTYTPYGKLAGSTGGTTTPFGYAGQYTDPHTGLIYLRARYYDPATAQFLTRDPLEALTGHPYSYANDNPINGTDPTGLDCGLLDPGGCVNDLAGTDVGANIVNTANQLSDYAGIASGACALTMFWNGVGEACLAAGAIAGGVNAATDVAQVFEGCRSLSSAAISVAGDGLLGGAGSKLFRAGSDAFDEATVLRDSGGLWNRAVGGFGRFAGQTARLGGATLNASGNALSNINAASSSCGCS